METYIVTGGHFSNHHNQQIHSPTAHAQFAGDQTDLQQTNLSQNHNQQQQQETGSQSEKTDTEHQQMLEVCSPVVSSTSHPEMKVTMRANYNHVGAGRVVQQENNIGSIITMLIDDQGADLDDILTDNRSADCRTRLEPQSGNTQVHHTEIKEEGCLSETLGPMSDYSRQYSSPDYYYQRDYIATDSAVNDKDIETRSSLSSNSEGDDIEMCHYNRGGYNQGPMMSNSNMMVSSPYMISRDTGQSVHQPGPVKKDDKYWERRRKNNLAAKKSRDARRVRENQLRLRVLCLENANRVLREQMDRKELELAQLRERLGKYETVGPQQTEHSVSLQTCEMSNIPNRN